jgi:hypothetical protein
MGHLRVSSCIATEKHLYMECVFRSSQYVVSRSHEEGSGVQVSSLESAKYYIYFSQENMK